MGLVVNPPVGFGMSVPVVLPDTLIVVLLTVVTGGTYTGGVKLMGGPGMTGCSIGGWG